jgi:DinB family protein
MYLDALSFLEDERDGWRAIEALDELTDEQLAVSLEDAHGWSGRDLMAHLVAWLDVALTVARELAVNESSPAKVQADADWDARGDEINEEIRLAWLALPMDEVRRRFRTVPGELRGYLTVVPESRWLKNPEYEEFFLTETIDHYEAHAADLAAVLDSAGSHSSL